MKMPEAMRKRTLENCLEKRVNLLVRMPSSAVCVTMWLLWFLQEPHGVTYHQTALFIVTVVKTSNLT
jgi:hypothetical protein